MRRLLVCCALGALLLLAVAGPAQAAAPSLGTASATDLQGVSALLKGTVDPGSALHLLRRD